MITIDFSKRGSTGLCEYLYTSVKSQILDGTLTADSKLPSKRNLASHLGISVITVQNAYAQLISEGYIYSIEKKGFFVTDISIANTGKMLPNMAVPDTGGGNLPDATPPANGGVHLTNAASPANGGVHLTNAASPAPCDGKPAGAAFVNPSDGNLPNAASVTTSGVHLPNAAPANTGTISAATPQWFADFTSNSTSAQKFPFTLWAHTMRQVLNSSDEKLLQRSNIKGTVELRTQITRYLKAFRNMEVSPEQIIIGAGTEALYSMLVQFFGRSTVFAVENPGYKKVRYILELNGANCIPIDLDEQGINPQKLEKTNASIIHISPNHHFPTGIVMPVRRRLELLAWVNSSANRFIIEDDYDSEFRFNGKPLPTLQSTNPQSNIIYMNTFTKTLSPSFRISYMVLPEAIVNDFVSKLGSYSCQVSAFEQFTLARFMEQGSYESHINRMKNYYRSIRNNFIQELQKSRLMPVCQITEEEAGLHFLLTIDSKASGQVLQKQLQSQGINISLLSDYFYDSRPEVKPTFVVNYSGLKKELISKTIKIMESALLSS